MSVSSTRRVSSTASYGASVKGAYEAAQGHQSFVETIDTSNNVTISDESHSGHAKSYQDKEQTEDSFEIQTSSQNDVLNSNLKSGRRLGPLLDNDEDLPQPSSQQSATIYGNNQVISHPEEEKIDNPYLKHLYEKNEIIEDVDEFV